MMSSLNIFEKLLAAAFKGAPDPVAREVYRGLLCLRKILQKPVDSVSVQTKLVLCSYLIAVLLPTFSLHISVNC